MVCRVLSGAEPKYSIVVMNENGKFGASDCCPVFKEIADGLHRQGYIK